MKRNLALTCLAFAYFGFGLAVEMFGVKAGLGLVASLVIFITSIVFYGIIVFTSMQDLKDFLDKKINKT